MRFEPKVFELNSVIAEWPIFSNFLGFSSHFSPFSIKDLKVCWSSQLHSVCTEYVLKEAVKSFKLYLQSAYPTV